MAKAIWNGKVVAESDRIEVVEGNIYFPPEALKREYFADSNHTSICPWKGTAGYFSLTVDGKTRTPPGSTLTPSLPRPISKASWPSGVVSR